LEDVKYCTTIHHGVKECVIGSKGSRNSPQQISAGLSIPSQ